MTVHWEQAARLTREDGRIMKKASNAYREADLRRAAEELKDRPGPGLVQQEAETASLCRELERRLAEQQAQAGDLRRAVQEKDAALGKCTDLYDFAPVGFFTLDRAGQIGAVNLSGARLLGMERSRLIGRPFGTFVSRETGPALAALLARTFESRGTWSCEVTLPGQGGRPLYARIDAAACDSGLECRLAVVDITENREAQEALAASESRYRRLFETAKDGILILEADTGRITDVNPSLSALLGYPREEFLDRKLWEVGVFADASAGCAAFKELRDHGCLRYQDLPLTAKDGRQLIVDFVSNVYQVDQARVIQCDLRDITSRKQAEAALLNSEEQCRTIVSNINEYVYSVRFEDGAITSIYHSPKCYDITGYSPGEYYQDPLLWFTMIHDDDRELVTGFLNHVLSGHDHPPIRHRIRHKDGSERWLLNNCAVQRIETPEASAISRRTASSPSPRKADF